MNNHMETNTKSLSRSLQSRGSLIAALVMVTTSCATSDQNGGDLLESISDRGVQEHGKVAPRSIDSAYMGTWGDNRNSGSTLVTGFEQRKFAAQSEYISWTEPNSPPVSGLLTNGSTEAPNGLIIAASPRGGGTSTVVALNLQGKVVWRTEEWTGDDLDENGVPDQAGTSNAVASSAGIQAPMVGNDGGVYVTDNYGVWKLDQDTGETIWFSRFSDYSGNTLASNDLRLLNEGENGLVGNVFASGWHIWLDTTDGSPVIVKEPDPFEATDCDFRAKFFIWIAGGELDKGGELDELVCLAYNANNTTPQPNNLAVRPAIPGVSTHARYIYTYPAKVGMPGTSRLMAYDFVDTPDGLDLEFAWERILEGGGTGASPTLTPDYTIVNASDDQGNVNFTSVEDGSALPDPSIPFNSFGSPGNTIDGWFCDLFNPVCVDPLGIEDEVVYDTSGLPEIAAQVLPDLTEFEVPMLWGGTPDAELIGGAIMDPVRANFSAGAGYPYALGEQLSEFLRLGELTPTAVFPISYDLYTGELMPGQNFAPEVSQVGTSEANGMVITSGRYVAQKADLLTLFYYYMFQGNYNFFNINEVTYDDNSPEAQAAVEGISATFNDGEPIPPEGVVPDPWKVGQPVSGLMIFEPLSLREAALNQIKMDVGHVEWALPELCRQVGCALEEAAARLGYAAWNLDKAFQKQLAEAETRDEVDPATVTQMKADAQTAADDCRAARALLLSHQPAIPSEAEVTEATELANSCLDTLNSISSSL